MVIHAATKDNRQRNRMNGLLMVVLLALVPMLTLGASTGAEMNDSGGSSLSDSGSDSSTSGNNSTSNGGLTCDVFHTNLFTQVQTQLTIRPSGNYLVYTDLGFQLITAECSGAQGGNVTAVLGHLAQSETDTQQNLATVSITVAALPGAGTNHTVLLMATDLISSLSSTIKVIPLGNGSLDPTPRISLWPGKVNQHNDNGIWMTDTDGVSGGWPSTVYSSDYADRKVAYCQKFWPNTMSIQLRDFREEITFWTRGNTDPYVSIRDVYECVLGDNNTGGGGGLPGDNNTGGGGGLPCDNNTGGDNGTEDNGTGDGGDLPGDNNTDQDGDGFPDGNNTGDNNTGADNGTGDAGDLPGDNNTGNDNGTGDNGTGNGGDLPGDNNTGGNQTGDGGDNLQNRIGDSPEQTGNDVTPILENVIAGKEDKGAENSGFSLNIPSKEEIMSSIDTEEEVVAATAVMGASAISILGLISRFFTRGVS